jgi:hypothetical protein
VELLPAFDQGVGPASASAILTAGFSRFPYFSDEAMDVALGNKKQYTVKRYIDYALAMREKALLLSLGGTAHSNIIHCQSHP